MKKKYFLVFIALFIIILSFLIIFLLRQTKTELLEPPNNSLDNKDNIVGADRDEHGCIGSAGYSWCEIKEKCLRIWEEPCKEENICGIENCHGLDIICGSQPAEVCTEIYSLGDKCRKYAQCTFKEGACQQEESLQFNNCKSCVEDCLKQYEKDQVRMFECENHCS